MDAKIGVVTDATDIFDANITRREAVIRVLLSAALLSVFFIDPLMPLKIIFVVPALYLFVTAIMHWDPGYAFIQIRKAAKPTDEPSNLIEAIIQENSDAANDPGGPGHGNKKAG